MRAKIKEARQEGYSDQEILDFLSQSDKKLSPKISEAIKEGYDPSEILSHLSPEPSNIRSILSAPVKGIVKGLGGIAQMGVPLAFEEEPFEERQKIISGAEEARRKFEKGSLEEALPTRERFLEKGLERGGELFPATAIGSGGLVGAGIRSMLAGFAGEGIKEAGGGPIAQSIGEIFALGAPGLGKKISGTKSQKPLVDFARKMGLTEEEIAPLIQGEKKTAFLGKIAKKKGRAEEALQKSFEAAGGIFEKLEQSPLAQKTMSPDQVQQFLKDTQNVLKKLPVELRQRAMGDYMDFVRSIQEGKGNAAELINLWKDLNYYVKKGDKALGLLKEPIENAFKRGYPGLSEEFELTRDLYKRYFPLAKKLRTGIGEELLEAGEAGSLIYGILKGNFSFITNALGLDITRKLARELLINPRLQNLHRQMLKAANERKFGIAQSIADKMLSEINQNKQTKSQEG